MPAISRRHLLAAGAALAGACAFPSSPKAQQLRQINFITPLNYLIGYAPTLNAQAGGHFAKEGLDVTILPGKGSAVAVQQVIAGRAAVRSRRPAGDGKSHRTRRTDYRVRHHLAPLANHDLQLAEETDPQCARHGRKGHRHRRLRQRIRQHPGHDARHERAKPDAVRREAIGNSPGGWGLIQQGRVDAHIVSIGTTTVLKEQGEDIVAWPIQRRLADARTSVLHSTRDAGEGTGVAAEDSPRREGLGHRGQAWRRAEIVSRIAKLWEVEGAKQVDFTVKAMHTEEQLWWQDDTSKLLKNDPVSWKTMIEAMIKAGFLKSGKPEDFYTDEITSKL